MVKNNDLKQLEKKLNITTKKEKEKLKLTYDSALALCEKIKKDKYIHDIHSMDYLLSINLISFESNINISNDVYIVSKSEIIPRNLITSINRLIKLIIMDSPEFIINKELMIITAEMYKNNICNSTAKVIDYLLM